MSCVVPGPQPLRLGAQVWRWVAPVVCATVCLAGVAALVPPALAAASETGTSTGRPSIHLSGSVPTDALPDHPSTSVLTVSNTGTVALFWRVRGTLAGTAAAHAAVEVLAAVSGSCPMTGASISGWSPSALAPGESTAICVRVSTDPAAAGHVLPSVTVDARAA